MKLYQEYIATRQLKEDFFTWLLIRKMKFRHQCIVIGLLIVGWLMAAPYLVFWVNFFKSAIFLSFVLLLFYIGKKMILILKEEKK